ncbi:MAG TPA: tetratricopeptide repeat protein [Rhizomicrobium sp.]|nr:tetratricopeptide repeat protein [Rhizomicrobium sp.]
MTRPGTFLWLAFIWVPLMIPPAARAQTAQDMEACRDQASSADQAIIGCDAVIAANNFGGENLSLAFTRRCAAHRARGEHDLALADCSKAIELDPSRMAALYIRGAEYEAKGELDKARDDYGRVIAINSGDFNALNRRAWIYAKQKQYDRAIADFTQAVESDDDGTMSSENSLTRATIFGNRCWVRALAKQFDEAQLDCNAGLSLELSVGLLDDRGFLYFQMGQYDKAIGQYNAALRVDPGSAASLYERGLAELRSKQPAKGNDDIAAAKKVQPEIAGQLAALGLE